MSKLWNTLKSVVGTAAKQAEAAAPPVSPVAASSITSPQEPPPQSDGQSTGLLQSLVSVKPHIPLIKFRKGLADKTPVTGVAGTNTAPPVGVTGSVILPVAGGSLEWWEVPAKFRREAIDETECEAINNGGREMPWC